MSTRTDSGDVDMIDAPPPFPLGRTRVCCVTQARELFPNLTVSECELLLKHFVVNTVPESATGYRWIHYAESLSWHILGNSRPRSLQHEILAVVRPPHRAGGGVVYSSSHRALSFVWADGNTRGISTHNHYNVEVNAAVWHTIYPKSHERDPRRLGTLIATVSTRPKRKWTSGSSSVSSPDDHQVHTPFVRHSYGSSTLKLSLPVQTKLVRQTAAHVHAGGRFSGVNTHVETAVELCYKSDLVVPCPLSLLQLLTRVPWRWCVGVPPACAYNPTGLWMESDLAEFLAPQSDSGNPDYGWLLAERLVVLAYPSVYFDAALLEGLGGFFSNKTAVPLVKKIIYHLLAAFAQHPSTLALVAAFKDVDIESLPSSSSTLVVGDGGDPLLSSTMVTTLVASSKRSDFAAVNAELETAPPCIAALLANTKSLKNQRRYQLAHIVSIVARARGFDTNYYAPRIIDAMKTPGGAVNNNIPDRIKELELQFTNADKRPRHSVHCTTRKGVDDDPGIGCPLKQAGGPHECFRRRSPVKGYTLDYATVTIAEMWLYTLPITEPDEMYQSGYGDVFSEDDGDEGDDDEGDQ